MQFALFLIVCYWMVFFFFYMTWVILSSYSFEATLSMKNWNIREASGQAVGRSRSRITMFQQDYERMTDVQGKVLKHVGDEAH